MSANQIGIKNHQYRHGYNRRGDRHPLYSIWGGMKYRCFFKDNPAWQYYGGRGITVCNEWLNFENFRNDMEDSYRPGLSLERIDVNGNYCKDNCIWIPRKDQMKNTTKTKKYEYGGESMLLSDWAIKLGFKRSTLSQRLYTYKWSLEDTLTRPIHSRI